MVITVYCIFQAMSRVFSIFMTILQHFTLWKPIAAKATGVALGFLEVRCRESGRSRLPVANILFAPYRPPARSPARPAPEFLTQGFRLGILTGALRFDSRIYWLLRAIPVMRVHFGL